MGTVNMVKTNMHRILEVSGIDVDANNCISRSEFEQLLMIPEAVRQIKEVGVDAVGLVDYADFIFDDGKKELSFSDFFEILLSLRGKNAATVKDIVDLRKFVFQMLCSGQELVPERSTQFSNCLLSEDSV